MEDKILKSGVTLVDFWAPWCGPCKALTPILNDLELEFRNDNFKLIKINVDDDIDENGSSLAELYSIRAIPTLYVYKDGNKVETINGLTSKQNLINKIKQYLQ